jgi:hypothetical protein
MVKSLNQQSLRRWLLYLPFLVFVAINLAGTFYVTNRTDFNTFLNAGEALQTGQAPYEDTPKQASNLNPPISLLVFQFLSKVEPHSAYQVWRVFSLVFYILIIILLGRAYPHPDNLGRVIWALCMTGLWYTLLLGQLYTFLLLIVTFAWLLLKANKPILAGLLIGTLAAIKPNFLVWPILLILSGSLPAAIATLGTFGLLSTLPLFYFHPGIYLEWLRMLSNYPATPLATNMSLSGFAARLGAPWLGFILAGLLLVYLGWATWRKKPDAMETSALAIVAALLSTTFAWVGYAVLLLPIFYSRKWSPLLAIAAILLCIPSIIIYNLALISQTAQILSGMIYIGGLSLVLFELVGKLDN